MAKQSSKKQVKAQHPRVRHAGAGAGSDPLRDRMDRPEPPIQAVEGDEQVIEEDLRLKEGK